ncbi:hypothetical protein, partial [Streptomyces sp. Adlamb9]|uniref:hypothetical protein n=1 Tax=Streptomyces sp. Adlamb9 TaxID=3400629 RepID=UPI003F1CB741
GLERTVGGGAAGVAGGWAGAAGAVGGWAGTGGWFPGSLGSLGSLGSCGAPKPPLGDWSGG